MNAKQNKEAIINLWNAGRSYSKIQTALLMLFSGDIIRK